MVDVAEATALIAYIKQVAPAQRIDEYTADAWADVLEDIPFEPARLAAKAVLKREPFVAPYAIIEEYKRQRAKTLESASPGETIPAADPDDPRAFLRALRSGHFQPQAPRTDRDVAALLAGVQRALPAVPHTGRRRPTLRPAAELPRK